MRHRLATPTASIALVVALGCACQRRSSDDPPREGPGDGALRSAPVALDDVNAVCQQYIQNVYTAIDVDLSATDRATNMRSCTSYFERVRADHGDEVYRAAAECTLRQSRANPRRPINCKPNALANE